MKIGLIDYFLDEWHANNYPEMLKTASDGEIEVAYAYGEVISPYTGKNTEEWCKEHGIAQGETIEEIVEKSDALIVLAPDNCEEHERLSELPLKSGKKTYIDKCFAPDFDTAKRIFDLAHAYKTPMWSSSALRFAPEYRDIENVQKITSVGADFMGVFKTYAIHQLEPVVMLMKRQPDRVLYQEDPEGYTMLIVFEDGTTASVTGVGRGGPFAMNVTTEKDVKTFQVASGYFKCFIAALVDFFRTGKPQAPEEDTLRIAALIEIGRSGRSGEWITVKR